MPLGIKNIWTTSCSHDAEVGNFNNIWRQASIKNNVVIFESLAKSIAEQERNGASVRLKNDSHWNDKGNKVGGTSLAAEINRYLLDQKLD